MGLLDDYAQGLPGPWNAFYSSPLQGADAATVPSPAPSPAPDSTIAIGNDYQMPQFGAPPSPSSASAGAAAGDAYGGAYGRQAGGAYGGPADGARGFGDRLTASLASIAHSKGLIPSIVNGANAFASGTRTDPDALQARGASAADTQAALANPSVMQALINQYYGAAPRGARAAVARPVAAAGGDNTDAPAQVGASSSTPAAPAAPPPLTMPTRPRLLLPVAQGVTKGGINWRAR